MMAEDEQSTYYAVFSNGKTIRNIHSYLEAEANYLKPKLERNNIVNKGVWVRNKFREKLFEKTSLGDVIFRPSSLDADRLLQTNFDAFAGNAMEESPFLSSYVERVRRSPDQIRKRHARKGMKNRKTSKISIEDSKLPNSKIVPNLKPITVLNDYSFAVAFLPNNRKELPNLINDVNDTQNNSTRNDITTEENATEMAFNESKNNYSEATSTETNKSPPKRSKKHNYGIDNNEPFNIIDDFNKTANEKSKTNRNVFDKDDRVWHQNAPIPDTNMYEVVSKDHDKIKGVTERGLIKVISMLTKTFKKVMKQHNEVKQIYEKFNAINDEFIKQVNDMNLKFQDFDSKYSDMIQFNDRMKTFEDKLSNEEEYLNSKHKDMDKNIMEFENQQKKFLAQQKQFYTIQKVMLAQNEKINIKQGTIAKTQSEISHRQNNFARILKKAKHLFIDYKKPNNTKDNNEKVVSIVHDNKTTVQTTTDAPSATETIKLNLFSIPTKYKLQNQDDQIIKEKDERTVDDLVYKYYFNNTFIDNLMKIKILNDYATNTNSIEIARNVKNKREKLNKNRLDITKNVKNNRDELETTLLLPISNSKDMNKNRVRRWINHLSDKKHKIPSPKQDNIKILKTDFITNKPESKIDPFLTMAKSFCNEIGQNTNEQSLKWCIEKALRRLRFMDKKLFSKPITAMNEKKPQTLKKVPLDVHTTAKPEGTMFPAPSTVWMTTKIALEPVNTPLYAVPQSIFFPDNEELESNLKQFDLTPDTEGTVYYDGSLHFSDIKHHLGHDSDGMSDFMPGLVDSNSMVEINPMAFDIQAKRRAYVNRFNEDMMKKLSRKL